MISQAVLENIKPQQIGRRPVVVLSLPAWQEIAEQLEELAMINSRFLRKRISKARAEKKFYSFAEVRKMLKI